MKIAKTICVLIVAIVFISEALSMARWTENRGVWDDFCYLRQAHLFQTLGFGGLDTDISRNTDHYIETKLKQGGWPGSIVTCFDPKPATGKTVMFYPPGTGFLLALFPEGNQVASLYMACTLIILLLAATCIALARSNALLATATVLGCLSVYWMINPAKASYSVAPTMVVCILAGFLTALLVASADNKADDKVRLLVCLALGFLLGLSCNLRIANALLATGYIAFFALRVMVKRNIGACREGAVFLIALAVGSVPTMIANTINGGEPFAKLYPGEVSTLAISNLTELASRTVAYLTDTQGVVMLASIGIAIYVFIAAPGSPRQLAFLVAVGGSFNLLYFITHNGYNAYYLMPASMLSVWSLFFGAYFRDRSGVGSMPSSIATKRSALLG
jgi:hypothetical protein